MPQKLTPEEVKKLKLRNIGKKHPVRRSIERLEVGEIIKVSRKEFTWKQRTPQLFCNEISKKTDKEFRVRVYDDNTAWVVERLV